MRARPIRVSEDFRKIIEEHRLNLMRECDGFVSFREATASLARQMNQRRSYGKKWRKR